MVHLLPAEEARRLLPSKLLKELDYLYGRPSEPNSWEAFRGALYPRPKEPECWMVLWTDSKDTVGGVFQFTFDGNKLRACGTIVRKKFRKKGIAREMWDYVLWATKPKIVDVITISKGGNRLVEGLEANYTWVKWEWLSVR